MEVWQGDVSSQIHRKCGRDVDLATDREAASEPQQFALMVCALDRGVVPPEGHKQMSPDLAIGAPALGR